MFTTFRRSVVILVVGALVLATATAPIEGQDTATGTKTTQKKIVQYSTGGDVSLPLKAPTFRRIIQVYDPETQEGIADVEVIDRITGNSMKTSSTGHVMLLPEFVRATGALLVFRKMGYDAVEYLADPKSDTMLIVPMSRTVTTLPGMEVKATTLSRSMMAFTERAKVGDGTYVTPEEYKKKWWGRGAFSLEDMLRSYPQFNIAYYKRGNKRCRQETYVDGILNNEAGGSADDYQAMEFYSSPSKFPAGYGTAKNVCTVFMLWTRDPE